MAPCVGEVDGEPYARICTLVVVGCVLRYVEVVIQDTQQVKGLHGVGFQVPISNEEAAVSFMLGGRNVGIEVGLVMQGEAIIKIDALAVRKVGVVTTAFGLARAALESG